MRFKLFSIILATVFIVMGCQTTNEEGMRDGTRDGIGTNVEQTRYNENDNINNRANRDNRMNETPMNENRNDNRARNRDNNNRNKDNNVRDGDRYDQSEEAADKITEKIKEIDHAYVLTMNNNAYVAANLDNDAGKRNNNKNMNDEGNANNADGAKARDNANNADNGEELTDDVKKQISDIVQSVDNDIDNVYVTTNPDFADLTNDYVNDMNAGKPVEGFFDQIGNMIDRVFPQDKR